MSEASARITDILKRYKIEKIGYLPCDRLKVFAASLSETIPFWNLSRENTGVGLTFGWHLGGRRGGLLIQSTGLGNSITEILTLPMLYRVPLPLFVSLRGCHNETIEAQTILGKRIVPMLEGLQISFSEISKISDIEKIEKGIKSCYQKSSVMVFLLSPQLWENDRESITPSNQTCKGPYLDTVLIEGRRFTETPRFQRYDAIELVLNSVDDKTVVIVQIGYPAREAYAIKDRDRNLYLLGALGSATLVGIGLAEARPDLNVLVIDGDGSYLFNPNQLLELGRHTPENLTVVLLDNGAWGSTGSQPTLTSKGINLSALGSAAGTKEWFRVSTKNDWETALANNKPLIHFLIQTGNAPVGTVPLEAEKIKTRFLQAIQE